MQPLFYCLHFAGRLCADAASQLKGLALPFLCSYLSAVQTAVYSPRHCPSFEGLFLWVFMTDLDWIVEARRHIGMREIVGHAHNPKILEMLRKMGGFTGEHKAWWAEDETAWCGLFVGYCLGASGRFVIPSWYRAKDWARHAAMTKLDTPAYGCLAVFERKGGGHVGFVVGEDDKQNIMVLGGNQGNAVNIKPFARSRVSAYVWPARWVGVAAASIPSQGRYKLPLYQHNLQLSNNEA